MLETPHVVVGAAIAYKVGNPALALPLAFGSHFILDQILHWNPHVYTETKKYGIPSKKSTQIEYVDVSLAVICGLSIAALSLPDVERAIIIILASFASVLSDLFKFPFYYMHSRNKLIVSWVNIERKIQIETNNPYLGILTQLIIILFAYWWVLS